MVVEILYSCCASRVQAGALKTNLTTGKVWRGESEDTPNNSMDVRAKQRLCYRVVFLPFACVLAVSPHVISAVICLVVKCYAYRL